MKTLYEILTELRSTTKTNEKKEILKNNYSSDLKDLFHIAYNDDVYGIKKLKDDIIFLHDSEELNLYSFKQLCKKLKNRVITGHAAQEAIIQWAAENSSEQNWNKVLFPALKKDLDCGTTSTLFNSIAPEKDQIIKFAPMGAINCTIAKKFLGQKYVQDKEDGVRATIFVDPEEKTVEIISRNGKPYKNFSSIEQAVLENAQKNFHIHEGDSYFLDGEIISDDFQTLSKQLQRKDDVNCDDARFRIFDIVIHNESDVPLTGRLDNLNKMFVNTNSKDKLSVIPTKLIEFHGKETEVIEFYQTLMEEAVSLRKMEGIIVKDPSSQYLYKKDSSWKKIKPHETMDLPIIRLQEGEKKYQNMLGAFVVGGTDPNISEDKTFEINVGTGLSDELREEVWKNQENYLGKIIEIRFDSITKAQDSDIYSVRFPRFVRFREDK